MSTSWLQRSRLARCVLARLRSLLAGASVNARTRNRATPLLAAAAAGHASTVAALLAARGRFLNARDASGLTPLAHARRAGHAGAAKLLEAAGAKL